MTSSGLEKPGNPSLNTHVIGRAADMAEKPKLKLRSRVPTRRAVPHVEGRWVLALRYAPCDGRTVILIRRNG